MRYKFYREHKYVSFALNDLEREVAKADFRSLDEVEALLEELEEVVEMLKGHAEYENLCLHALLKKKGSKLSDHVEEDHKEYDIVLDNLLLQLENILEEEDDEKRVEAGYQFYLAYRKFVGENLLHLHEEETIILPELQRLYTDEELKKVEAETYRQMSPEQLIEMLEVLFPHMNFDDKRAFLEDIQDATPEKYPLVLLGIRAHLSSD